MGFFWAAVVAVKRLLLRANATLDRKLRAVHNISIDATLTLLGSAGVREALDGVRQIMILNQARSRIARFTAREMSGLVPVDDGGLGWARPRAPDECVLLCPATST